MTTPKEGGDYQQNFYDKAKLLTETVATRRFFQKLRVNKVATGHIESITKSNQIQRELKNGGWERNQKETSGG